MKKVLLKLLNSVNMKQDDGGNVSDITNNVIYNNNAAGGEIFEIFEKKHLTGGWDHLMELKMSTMEWKRHIPKLSTKASGNQNRLYCIFMLLFLLFQVSCGVELSPVSNPLISTYGQKVDLVWNCRDISPYKIRFTRGNLVDDVGTKFMAEWTSTTGLNTDAFYSTPLEFNYDENDDKITLELTHTIREDFKQTYYCDIILDDGINITSSIKLEVEVPSYNATDQIKVRVGEEATFQLQYIYRYLATLIIFRQKDRETGNVIDALGYWYYQNKFIEYEPFKGRLKFIKVSSPGSGENITLVIYNITNTELHHDYECCIILDDGQDMNIDFTLEKKEIETTTQTEIISTFTGVSLKINPHEMITSDHTPVVVGVISSVLFLILIVIAFFLKRRRSKLKAMKAVSSRGNETENINMI